MMYHSILFYDELWYNILRCIVACAVLIGIDATGFIKGTSRLINSVHAVVGISMMGLAIDKRS